MKKSDEGRKKARDDQKVRGDFDAEEKVKRKEGDHPLDEETGVEGLSEPIPKGKDETSEGKKNRISIETLPLRKRLFIEIIPFVNREHDAGKKHQKKKFLR